jgi:hypothetical protein
MRQKPSSAEAAPGPQSASGAGIRESRPIGRQPSDQGTEAKPERTGIVDNPVDNLVNNSLKVVDNQASNYWMHPIFG